MPAALPGARDAFLIPQADALDPFSRHDTLGGKFVVDLGNVDFAIQTGLTQDEAAHVLCIAGLILEVSLQHETFGDVWDERVKWDVKPPGVDFGDDSVGRLATGRKRGKNKRRGKDTYLKAHKSQPT